MKTELGNWDVKSGIGARRATSAVVAARAPSRVAGVPHPELPRGAPRRRADPAELNLNGPLPEVFSTKDGSCTEVGHLPIPNYRDRGLIRADVWHRRWHYPYAAAGTQPERELRFIRLQSSPASITGSAASATIIIIQPTLVRVMSYPFRNSLAPPGGVFDPGNQLGGRDPAPSRPCYQTAQTRYITTAGISSPRWKCGPCRLGLAQPCQGCGEPASY